MNRAGYAGEQEGRHTYALPDVRSSQASCKIRKDRLRLLAYNCGRLGHCFRLVFTSTKQSKFHITEGEFALELTIYNPKLASGSRGLRERGMRI